MSTTITQPAPVRSIRDRVLFEIFTELSRDEYGETYETENRRITERMSKATVVSSLTGENKHAPCLDLDFRCVLTRDEVGAITLWVDAPLSRFWFRRFLKRAKALGLVTAELVKADLEQDARMAAYVSNAGRAVDTTVRDTALRNATTPPGFTMEQALSNVEAATGNGTRTAHLGELPEMVNPWPIPLADPDAHLIPSKSNYHLYLDAALEWRDYKRLLKLARRARLLESGYAKVSIGRRGTHLRFPWSPKK